MRLLKRELEIFPESIFAMSDPSRGAHVRCRREKALARYAAENHIAYYVPQYEELVRRNGPTNVSSLPQFAGYLFVIITDGAFDGFGGVIVRERSIERIVVSISFIRRSVAAEVNRDAIRPLTAKRNARKRSPLVHFATATLLALTSFITPAHAQLASDEVPRERIVPRSEEIRRDLEDSRYHLGPFHLRPLFGIRDFGYDNNVFGTSDQAVADWRSTVAAGADVILRLGNKMYATGIINPEYTYFQKLTDRRLLGGEYGASLIALFNRLSVEAGGVSDKTIAPVSSELERSAPGTRDDLFARSELEIFRRLSVFGSVQEQRQRYEVTQSDRLQGINLDQLERNETFVRGGIRYRPRSFIDFSVAAENGRSEFVSARQSDNNSHAVILGIHYDRPRLYVNVSAGRRTGEARGPLSTFPSFSTTTGSYYAAYQLGAPLSIDTYGHRSIVYGLYVANPYYVETRTGLGLTLPVGQRVGLRVFGEAGSNGYPIAALGTKRTDEVTTIGGGLAYRLYRKVIVTITASDTRYDSNIAGYGRSIFRLATVLSLRGDSFR